MKKVISFIACFAGVAMASIAHACAAAFTNKAKTKPAANTPTLKEMLEAGHVITVQLGGVIGIGISNGDGITAAVASSMRANSERLGMQTITSSASMVVEKAKSWFDIAGQIERATKKASGYFAKTGAAGHFTGTGVAAIGA